MRLAGVLFVLVFLAAGTVLAAEAGPSVKARLEPGEGLADLARRYGVTETEIRKANPDLQAPGEGEAIRVPPPATGWPRHTVNRGETLWALATRYGVPLEEIREANSLSGDRLEAGQALLIPRARLPRPEPPRWLPVTLPDGRRGWVPSSAVLLPPEAPQCPEEVLALALRLQGTPYRWGGAAPDGVDCSGLVQEVYRMGGHSLPRLADEQFEATRPVEEGDLLPGDLVFFTTYLPGPSHVGIYLGDGRFLHASSSQGVTEERLDRDYFRERFLGGRRPPAWLPPEPARLQPEDEPPTPLPEVAPTPVSETLPAP